jgi:hypothetical protein
MRMFLHSDKRFSTLSNYTRTIPRPRQY